MEAPAAFDTERLTLRPHGLIDFADCVALWGDPATMRFIGAGQPLTAEDTWSRLLRYAGGWRLLGFGYWAVRERATGHFVGDVGFQDLRRTIEPPLGDRPEIGWVLARSAQGRGYAAEAVAGAVRWADANLAARETVCIVRPEHARSLSIAARAGYAATGAASYGGALHAVLVRPRVFPSAVVAPTC